MSFYVFVGTPATTASYCDDLLNDCDIANTSFGICNNFEAAKKSCAEFCGLCGIGRYSVHT